MVKLSKRLRAVTELVEPGHAVADVGCDHAYVPISLLLEGRSPYASASDVRSGPLKYAEENIEKEGLSERIRLELCSGVPKNIYRKMLETFEPDKNTLSCPMTLITAGMGGLLMKQIYEEAAGDLDAFDEIIASPQRDADTVRRFLDDRGYVILDERFLKDDGKYYPIIKASRKPVSVPARTADKRMRACEDLFGPVLLSRRDPVLLEYLQKLKAENDRIMESLKERDELSGSSDEAYIRAAAKLELIEAASSLYR